MIPETNWKENEMSENELTTIDEKDTGDFSLVLPTEQTRLAQLGNFIRETRSQIVACDNELGRMALQAGFLGALRKAVDGPIVELLVQLQNTPLGFKTDNPSGYPPEVVRDVAIQAFASGLRMVHNEVNIISGQLYGTKEGFLRLLREIPGFANLRWEIGNSEIVKEGQTAKGIAKGKAYISARATWTLNGVAGSATFDHDGSSDFRICLKYFGTDTEDLLRGKAESKVFRRVFQIVTGDLIGEQDEDSPARENTIDVTDTQYTVVTEPDAGEDTDEIEAVEENGTEILDRIDAFLHERLPVVESKQQVEAVRKTATAKLAASQIDDNEVYAAAKGRIDQLCDARKIDISNARGS